MDCTLRSHYVVGLFEFAMAVALWIRLVVVLVQCVSNVDCFLRCVGCGVPVGVSIASVGMSCIIGIIAGWMYLGFSEFLVKLRIDDAVDAVSNVVAIQEIFDEGRAG